MKKEAKPSPATNRSANTKESRRIKRAVEVAKLSRQIVLTINDIEGAIQELGWAVQKCVDACDWNILSRVLDIYSEEALSDLLTKTVSDGKPLSLSQICILASVDDRRQRGRLLRATPRKDDALQNLLGSAAPPPDKRRLLLLAENGQGFF